MKKFAPKPKRPMINWLEFILEDGAIPAVVEAKNNSGGIYRGGRFTAWDFEGQFYAIWNQAGNPVWCHKDNFNLLSKGTVNALSKIKNVECINDYHDLISKEIQDCGMKPTYRL